jgi:hypothetical protein
MSDILNEIKNLVSKELEDIGLDKAIKLEKYYGKDDARVKKARLEAFFRAYSILGTVRYAAQVCGLNPKAVSRLIRKSEAYRAKFEQAHEEFCQYLEETAVIRALRKSDSLLMFLLKANNPKKFSERLRLQAIDDSANEPVTLQFGEWPQGMEEPNYAAIEKEVEEEDAEQGEV